MALENVGRTLDIASAHLRMKDVETLKDYDGSWLKIHLEEDQFWIGTGCMFVGEADMPGVVSALKDVGFSDEFIHIMQTAADENIRIITFDRDAEYEPSFPIFDENDNDITADVLDIATPKM